MPLLQGGDAMLQGRNHCPCRLCDHRYPDKSPGMSKTAVFTKGSPRHAQDSCLLPLPEALFPGLYWAGSSAVSTLSSSLTSLPQQAQV